MENELKTNARKVGKEAQYEIRKTIIRMLKNGKKGKEIAKDLGVSEGHVSNIKKHTKKMESQASRLVGEDAKRVPREF